MDKLLAGGGFLDATARPVRELLQGNVLPFRRKATPEPHNGALQVSQIAILDGIALELFNISSELTIKQRLCRDVERG